MFLVGNELTDGIRSCWTGCSGPRIAVAFWGSNAASRLGLDSVSAPIRVICDLFSGACNPDEIEELVGRDNVEVRWTSGLHAKVYLGGKSCVVASANASANGLGLEDSEIDWKLEAGFLFQDSDDIKKAGTWFDTLWEDAHNRVVKQAAIERARRIWERRRTCRPWRNSSERSLLSIIRSNSPGTLANRAIRLWAYQHVEPSKAAREAANALNDPAVKRILDKGYFPGWELRKAEIPDPGTSIIDFEHNEKGQVRYNGIWKVREIDPIRTNGDLYFILADKISNVDGFTLNMSDGRILAKAISLLVRGDIGRELDLGLDEIAKLVQ